MSGICQNCHGVVKRRESSVSAQFSFLLFNFLYKLIILLLKITNRIMLHVSAYVTCDIRVLSIPSLQQLKAQRINHRSNFDSWGLNVYFVIILTLRLRVIVIPGHFRLRDGCHVHDLNLEELPRPYEWIILYYISCFMQQRYVLE